MFRKVLVANRGEIAVRIIRACRELDIRSVAVFSEADRKSLHVKLADQAVNLGKSPARESYLDPERIIKAARDCDADAIHPGYGFLSENSEFARSCIRESIDFIGPAPEIIESMGNKSEARERMRRSGVPIIPGSRGAVQDIKQVHRTADKIGYPVILKASAGGGGKGLRVVREKNDLENNLSLARQEARTYFKDDSVYIEKYIENGRHVEVQLLGDNRGNVVHLGDRDCSIQRRHQKLIEETPSPGLSAKLRKKMLKAAVKAARAVGYTSAGTVEFLVDQSGNFYFMEMNTRIQVEHPVSEMISGVDLVKAQLLIGSGAKLGYSQRRIALRGHALECRINAEDPQKRFFPTPGKIKELTLPSGPGTRIDTHIYRGYRIPYEYDSLIAKLIVWAENRVSAIYRMRRALREFRLEGIKTNIPFHLEMLSNPDFFRSEYDTGFIAGNFGKFDRE